MVILQKYIAVFYFLILFNLPIAKASIENKDTLEKVLIVNSLESIISANPNIVYDYIDIYELDSLIHGLESLEKLHFKKLFYQGHIRKKFPPAVDKVKELKEVSISGKKIENIPSFISLDSLLSLIVEANNYEIDFDLFKCKKLERLSLYTKNTFDKIDQLCSLLSLKKLVIQEKPGRLIESLGCLKNLEKLSSLYISLKLENLSQLSDFASLEELYICNRISYDFIKNNIVFFKKFKHVQFLDFRGTDKQKKMLKKELKDIWW